MASDGGFGVSGGGAGDGAEGGGVSQMQAQDVMQACYVKAPLSGVAGMGLGAVFGLITGSINNEVTAVAGESKKEFFKRTLKHAGQHSWRMAKGFGLIGAIYTGTECYVEKYYGAHRLANAPIAGCISGFVIAIRAGPAAATASCAGFAAFSTAIDYFIGH
ncbi:mitochondrial import inner membrane translocase subunit tim22 [Thecamonas trahens ATCC 50062]|uniref:Mitochondrial import inner membrane translocase subunit TIM22 n=1 Tax=Thecamonas trahens ATCC 50062 TaxID=461836 RepID=A0A0L0DVN5_THETB|nr:mitochondrial import inner membrane translocase subunit tim22 [Thecamonas trahens ATCC 50062]KNC56136.1 mitochondrial import inner membrane translocase subunit tim22 [Thecamonas trahens ATCC 50062]|eukprot:XP_013761175.1 mitochondrial import inner membrane translocase subunit tim22 [Thecamonas trahens ATCC 50062]